MKRSININLEELFNADYQIRKKAARQAEKRTAHNQQIKKDIKAALKAFKDSPIAENMAKVQSEYDKAVKKA